MSVWDAILEIDPWVNDLADSEGISRAYRSRYHARSVLDRSDFKTFQRPSAPRNLPGWHPLSFWNAICFGNSLTSLVNAEAILREHQRRKGTIHSVWTDLNFLIKVLPKISFGGPRWRILMAKKRPEWVVDLGKYGEPIIRSPLPFGPVPGSEGTPNRPLHYLLGLNIEDREDLFFTEPPRCINLREFPDCTSDQKGFKGLIEAYRKYYVAKQSTIKGGMRYYYSDPPPFDKWALLK